jgi:cell division protein YceG involved in septum cleavage
MLIPQYVYEYRLPGPIAMPDITALEAVQILKNDFIYFCASVERFDTMNLLLH